MPLELKVAMHNTTVIRDRLKKKCRQIRYAYDTLVKYVYFVKNTHVNITKITQYKHLKKYVHIHLRHGGSIKTAYAIACMRAP